MPSRDHPGPDSCSDSVCHSDAAVNLPVPGAIETTKTSRAMGKTNCTLIDEVIAASYRTKNGRYPTKPFRPRSVISELALAFLNISSRMRYLVSVNPRAFELQPPEAGLRAIVAHELAHVAYLKKRSRVRLLGLARLTSKRFTAKFERQADLTAISRGYGEGLKEYRRWLYKNVPNSKLAEKRRNYFSPDEIDAILSASRARPELFEFCSSTPLVGSILATK
jgi:hypothetical protein